MAGGEDRQTLIFWVLGAVYGSPPSCQDRPPFIWSGQFSGRRVAALNYFSLSDGCIAMKIKNSLRALRKRHRDNRLVRRRGRVYIINKINRRFKARQG